MKITLSFAPTQLDLAEKLVKHLREWHPGFAVKLDTDSQRQPQYYHYYLNDGRKW